MPPPFHLRQPLSAFPRRWAGLWALACVVAPLAPLPLSWPLGAAWAAPPASQAGPATAAAGAEASWAYTAVAGDTLIALGRRYLAEPAQWPQLQRLNGVRDPRRIPVGQRLYIPLRLMAGDAVPAQVLSASGDVRAGDGRPLRAGQTVPAGGLLHTGDGQATVQLVDGTVLRLRPASSLQVQASRRLPQLGAVQSEVRLREGQIEVKAAKSMSPPVPDSAGTAPAASAPAAAGAAARGGLPGFRVHTPQGLLGVRGTEFRVQVDGQAAVSRGEVLEGRVATDGNDGRPGPVVPAGWGVVVDRSGQVAPPVPLLPAPDLSPLASMHQEPMLRFALQPQPGAVAWRGQLAADPGFDHILADQRSTTPELRFANLPDGQYVLRVRAEDAHGLQGLDAQHAFTLKARPVPPLPSAPAPKAVLSGTQAELAWAAVPEAATYRVQIAKAEGFEPLLRDQRGIAGTRWPLEGLAPGTYHWRVASERNGGDQGPFGPPQGFELRPQPAPPGPPRIEEDRIGLAWQGLPGQSFQLQFATEPSFAAPAHEAQVDRPALELTLPASGRWYVRLRSRDADGHLSPYTAAQAFDIPHCLRDGSRRCVAASGTRWVLTAP